MVANRGTESNKEEDKWQFIRVKVAPAATGLLLATGFRMVA